MKNFKQYNKSRLVQSVVCLASGLVLAMVFLLFFDLKFYEAYSLGLIISNFFIFVDALGKRLPFREFIAFSASVFWVGAPVIMYLLYGYYFLFTTPEIYYSYSLPATAALTVGLYFPIKSPDDKMLLQNVKQFFEQRSKKNLQFILLIIGFVGAMMNGLSLPGIAFFAYLISQVLYVGALYALLTPSLSKVWVLGAVLVFTFALTIVGGMFGDLIWWGLIVVMILAMQYDFSFRRKMFLVTVGFITIIIIQQVKTLYREDIWVARTSAKKERTDSFTENLEKTVSSTEFLSKRSLYPFLFRLNQAYFSSLIVRHVPERQPYVEGETILIGSIAGFVPRFLWPDKPESGGKENMKRFGGYKLVGTTSIDMGNHMDGYVNFGPVWGVFFMFFYGLLISWLFAAFLRFSYTISPTIILWSPFVFIQVLKVETSWVTCFNAAIKGIFFVLMMFWFFKRILKINL